MSDWGILKTILAVTVGVWLANILSDKCREWVMDRRVEREASRRALLAHERQRKAEFAEAKQPQAKPDDEWIPEEIEL